MTAKKLCLLLATALLLGGSCSSKDKDQDAIENQTRPSTPVEAYVYDMAQGSSRLRKAATVEEAEALVKEMDQYYYDLMGSMPAAEWKELKKDGLAMRKINKAKEAAQVALAERLEELMK